MISFRYYTYGGQLFRISKEEDTLRVTQWYWADSWRGYKDSIVNESLLFLLDSKGTRLTIAEKDNFLDKHLMLRELSK